VTALPGRKDMPAALLPAKPPTAAHLPTGGPSCPTYHHLYPDGAHFLLRHNLSRQRLLVLQPTGVLARHLRENPARAGHHPCLRFAS